MERCFQIYQDYIFHIDLTSNEQLRYRIKEKLPLQKNQMQLIIVLLALLGLYFFIKKNINRTTSPLKKVDSLQIEKILMEEVDFYKAIENPTRRESFKNRVVHFLQQVRFTSVGNAKHELLDEVLIASSAIIPIFNFPDWEYNNIKEVLLYEDHFDENFKVDKDHKLMGMVGEGALNSTMLLSLRALREGFDRRDGSHTAIHEFVHLIDHADGVIDGVPAYLLPNDLITPWLRLIRGMIQDIKENETEINPYASTNEAEFFAVISEYFFEKPKLLERNHPQLYAMLKTIFKPK